MANTISTMQYAIDFIENNLGEKINPQIIAAQVCTSEFHFQRLFSILFGISLGEYIRNRRLSLAAERIKSTDEKIIDILPIRASKGLAIRYLSIKWGIALDRILVVGDSGNDEEMLMGDTLGVVVASHSAELDKLEGKYRVYFSPGKYADGILDGIKHYNFLGNIVIPEDEAISAD